MNDQESVRQQERKLQTQKTEHARFELLRQDVTRGEKNLQATEAEVEALRLTFVAGQEALRLQTESQRKSLSEVKEQFHKSREHLARLEFLSAPGPARRQLEENLATLDAEKISVQMETAKIEREQIAARLEAENTAAAENKIRMENLENDESLTQKRREVEAKEAELVELAQRWAVLKLTHALLEKTRLKFERERQPGVVLRAGSILKTLTDGAYAGVIASEGLDSVELETPLGARKRMGEWSRGTAEQLYLALRFALIEDYSKVAEPLPIVMDDVLVHADGYQRLRLAARTIGEVAQQHQVLYFTCRPGDADVLCAENPGARRYKLEQGHFALVA